jgi:hypothetical protein
LRVEGLSKQAKRIKPTYNDQFRSSAVVMLKAQGYPEMDGALSIVAKHLKVPASTLSRWFKGTSNPPPSNIVNETKRDLRDLFLDEIYAILKVLPDKRDEAGYQQLTTSLAIFFDKVRLLDNLPTEIVKVLPELVSELEKGGVKASDVFNVMLEKARAANAER